MDIFIFEQADGSLLEFAGERLVKVSTECSKGPGARRWHHLQLLRTEEGQYVVAIQYITRCPGERHRAHAWRGTPEQMLQKLKDYLPEQDVGICMLRPDEGTEEAVKLDIASRFVHAVQRIIRCLTEQM